MTSTERAPWLPPDGGGRLPALYGGVAAPGRLDRAAAVDALRAAVELVTSWVGVPVTWTTSVVVAEDDLRDPAWDGARPGIDWQLVDRPGTLATVTLSAVATQLAADATHPYHRVAEVHADLAPATGDDDGAGGRRLVAVSVRRWALYTDLPGRRLGADLQRWVLDAAALVRADTGYASLAEDWALDAQSAWERHATVPAAPEPGRLWGYGWGTLLPPVPLAAVGGTAALAALPDALVREVADGHVWLTLGDDPTAVPDAALHALHATLLSALAQRRLDEATRLAHQATTPLGLLSTWTTAADRARAAGLATGEVGPTGWTLAALDDLLGCATLLTSDVLLFDGLGGRAALDLLGRLGGAALDAHVGGGPTLRRALQAAAAHPGVVTLGGHVIGPARTDERMTVDSVVVRGDPVLDALATDGADHARARLAALGVDDAPTLPDDVRRTDGSWTFRWS